MVVELLAAAGLGAAGLIGWCLRRPLVAVAVVVAALPVGDRAVPHFPGGASAITLVAGVAVLLGAAAALHHRLRVPLRCPLVAAAAVLLGSAALSVLVAVSPPAALKLAATYLVAFGVAVLVVVTARTGSDLMALLRLFVAAAGGLCLVSVAELAGRGTTVVAVAGGAVVNNRLTGSFAQPNELGLFAGITAVCAVALAVAARHRVDVALGLAGGAAGLGALALSLSRGAWAGTAVGLLLLPVLLPEVRRRFVALVATAVAVAALGLAVSAGGPLGTVLADRLASFAHPTANPYDARPAIWAEALRQVEARPLLGAGPGGYPVLAATSVSSAVRGTAPAHAHDLALTVAAEQGLVGVGALGWLVLVGGRTVLRARRRLPPGPGRTVFGAAAGGLAVVLGQGIVDYPVRNALLAITSWLLIGWLAAVDRVAAADGPTAPAARCPATSPAERPAVTPAGTPGRPTAPAGAADPG